MEELLKKLIAPSPDTPDMSGFRFADLFDNERWRTTDRPSYGSKRDETIEFREYVPRPKKDVTEKITIGNDGKQTKTIVSKYVDSGEPTVTYDSAWPMPYERLADTRDAGLTPSRFMPSTFAEEGPGTASYAPPTMRDRFAEEGPGMGSYRGPVRTTGNPFGYPMLTAIQGPPRYTDVNRGMQGATPMMPISNARNFTPMAPIDNSRNFNPMIPIDQRTSEQTFAYNMVPLVRPEITPITTQSVPQGNRIPLSYNQQSQLNRFPFLGMDAMSDDERMRMLERLLIGRDD
jgi:hypothetical protein